MRKELLEQILSRVAMNDPSLPQFISLLAQLTHQVSRMFHDKIGDLKVCKAVVLAREFARSQAYVLSGCCAGRC